MTALFHYCEQNLGHGLLSHAETMSLIRVAQAGGYTPPRRQSRYEPPAPIRPTPAARAAMDRIVAHNQRLVFKYARHAWRRMRDNDEQAVTLDDLVQAGNEALMRAVRKFDPDSGYQFSTYAVWWVRQFISRYVASNVGVIHTPAHIDEALRRIRRFEAEYLAHNAREPSEAEILSATGMTPARYQNVRQRVQASASLDQPLGPHPDDGTLGELLPAADTPLPELAIHNSLKRSVRDMLDCLSPREAQVISMHFALDGAPPRTLVEIGRCLGVTRERARQIKKSALTTLAKTYADQAADLLALLPD